MRTAKFFEKKCLACQKVFLVKGQAKAFDPRKKCCSRQCLYAYNKKVNSYESESVECPNCQKHFIRKKIVKLQKYCSVPCAKKAAFGRKISEHHKQRISETRQRDWVNGIYEGVNLSRYKWYEYIKKDGSTIKVQGTWELKYAEWLDQNNIEFLTHKGALWYTSDDGKKRVYLPDFYLVKEQVYIDIKNIYTYNLNPNKYKKVADENPNITFKLLFKEDLTTLGIKL